MATKRERHIRLAQFIASTGLTQRQIASEIGLSYSTLSRKVNGEPLTADVAQRLQQHFGVSAQWLLTGEGEEHVAPKEIVVSPANLRLATVVQSPRVQVSREETLEAIRLRIVGCVAGDDSEGRLVDLEQVSGIYYSAGPRAVVSVIGTSMEPIARPGQWLVLDITARAAHNGDLVVAETNDGRVLAKRYTRSGGMVTLASINQGEHLLDSVTLPESDLVQVRVIVGVLFE